MYCKKCGTENSDGSRFCKKCGAELTPAVTPVDFPYEEDELIDGGHFPEVKNKSSKIIKVLIIVMLLIVAAEVGALFWPNIESHIKNYKTYNAAVSLIAEEKYGEAIAAFEELNGYKDSAEQIVSCQTALKEIAYNDAISLMAERKYDEAIAAFEELSDYKDSVEKINEVKTAIKTAIFKNSNVGDIVYFGAYEQDNVNTNGKEEIEWIVLDKKDGKALLISKYILAHRQYDDQTWSVWENCTLRTWLNNTFLNNAFSTEEQQRISTTYVNADKNPMYNTDPGHASYNRVFLLSIDEAEKYFNSSQDRKTVTTAYEAAIGENSCWWWLRSRGGNQRNAAYVYSDGSVNYTGSYVNYDNTGVRPALWIDLDS